MAKYKNKRFLEYMTVILTFIFFSFFIGLLLNGISYSLKNKDLINQYLHFDSIYILFSYFFAGLCIQIIRKQHFTNIKIFDRFTHFFYILLPLISILSIIILSLELVTYPNFVFSTFHIIPLNLMQFLFIAISTSLIHKLKNGSLSFLTLFFIVIIVFLLSLRTTLTLAMQKTVPFSTTYDEKMEYLWGDFYRYIEIVRKIVPENSTMLIPPQESPWLKEGNILLVRSFLYPRPIYPFFEMKNKLNSSFIIFSSGFMGRQENEKLLFPENLISCKQIYIFDLKNKSYTTKQCPYIPKDPALQNKYGLIQL